VRDNAVDVLGSGGGGGFVRNAQINALATQIGHLESEAPDDDLALKSQKLGCLPAQFAWPPPFLSPNSRRCSDAQTISRMFFFNGRNALRRSTSRSPGHSIYHLAILATS